MHALEPLGQHGILTMNLYPARSRVSGQQARKYSKSDRCGNYPTWSEYTSRDIEIAEFHSLVLYLHSDSFYGFKRKEVQQSDIEALVA